ncbi:MAG TPA: M20 family peptidase [Candidatus Caldiarchaeum subterraneum]|uniref:Probable succinyl-diaminopimelate desuccinylase n=1 Tax=Caldiarchaeum subterraneum TaxID=311458 RepID=A0A832ZW94_CALS0|nr:M20 family peptidase [Candidatus Caldarchaeum subterraneum]
MKLHGVERFVVDVTKTLVRINTENPPGREREAAGYVADLTAELGLRTTIQEFAGNRANVVAILEAGEGDSIMLNSHLDTVPVGDIDSWPLNPFEAVERDGRIYGRGAADAKGPVASMLGALKMLIESEARLRGKVIFAAVADEEAAGLGSVNLVKQGYAANYVIIGEPTSLQLCRGNYGRIEFSLTVKGKPSHASLPQLGVNAINITADLIKIINTSWRDIYKNDKITATVIEGGIKPNVVPDYCRLKIDYREAARRGAEKVKKRLDKLISGAVRRKYKKASYTLSINNYAPAVVTSRKSKLVRTASEVLKEARLKHNPVLFPATTDLSRITQHINAEGIVLGPGGIETAHTNDEYVEIRELTLASQIYAEIITKMLSGEKDE